MSTCTRRLISAVLILLADGPLLRGQTTDERFNSVSAGLAIPFGMYGASYVRAFTGTPVSAGLAAGEAGAGARIRLTVRDASLVRLRPTAERIDLYLDVGVYALWPSDPDQSWWTVSLGQRHWLDVRRRWFAEVGLDYLHELREAPGGLAEPVRYFVVLPHLRAGYAF